MGKPVLAQVNEGEQFPPPMEYSRDSETKFTDIISWSTDIISWSTDTFETAQSPELNPNSPPSSTDDESLLDLKNKLRIEPFTLESRRTYPPSLTFAPSAFGANWGDVFVTVSGASAGRNRDKVDGYVGAGFGIGDADRLIGATVTVNAQSVNNFGSTNGIDLDLHRVLYRGDRAQVAIAGGWTNLIQFYDRSRSSDTLQEGVWGGITSYIVLRPDNPNNTMPIALTVGGGSGQYDSETDVGIFGGIGIQLAPQLGAGIAWSGVGLDVGVSFVPISTFPLTLTLVGADLTDNTSGGPRVAASINFGYSFVPRGN